MAASPSARGIIEAGVFSIIAGLTYLALDRSNSFLSQSGWPYLIAGTVGIVAALAAHFAWTAYDAIRRAQAARRNLGPDPDRFPRMGVEFVYDKWEEAEADFVTDLSVASNVRFLLQIGSNMFGSTHAVAYRALERRSGEKNLNVRIARATKGSPVFKEERLVKEGYAARSNHVGIDHVGDRLVDLQNLGIRIEKRQHDADFEWTLYFVDDLLYAVGYFRDHDNLDVAPVYKIRKSEFSLYVILEKHFDHIWAQGTPEP